MKRAIADTAKDLGVTKELVTKVYNGYWSFIRFYLSSLPLKANLTERQFEKLRTSINIAGLGKMGCTYKSWLKISKKIQENAEYKEDKADV